MKKSLLLLAVLMKVSIIPASAPVLEIARLENRNYQPLMECSLADSGTFNSAELSVNVKRIKHGDLTEYLVSPHNTGKDILKLRFRLKAAAGTPGGVYWDGYEYHREAGESVQPRTNRYNFPASAYLKERRLCAVGFAPSTLSSRFERQIRNENGGMVLVFDHFLALTAGETSPFSLIHVSSDDAAHCIEAVECIYNTYPDAFRPVPGADERIYGVGGYFFSSEKHRAQQLEEARRFGFNWEWYYNAYQKAGDFYPSAEFWDKSTGYKTEKAHAACDTPGTIADWEKYNQERIRHGNRSAALFYYYLQQYCNSDLLARVYPDCNWVTKDGKPGYKTHGWAEEGWAGYAWPGRKGTFGEAVREDLKKLWSRFDLAGFALDCAIGDTRYYGPLALAEPGKAFDDDGRIFAVEGVALAYNMDYTRNLPARADGRRAASIINEPYVYLPAFHCDASIHEMPPFERIEIIAPRRMMVGQKPYYWWKGFRIDSLLRWNELTPEEIHEGLSGVVKYTIMATLRFGAVPAIFYERGFEDMVKYRDTFVKLQKLGWRAAPFAAVDGSGNADPYAEDAEFWISRFGNGDDSYIVISSPDSAEKRGKLRIHAARFGAARAVYAAECGGATVNTVTDAETVVDFVLRGHQPLILRKVAVAEPGKVTARQENTPDGGCRITLNEKAAVEKPAEVVWSPSPEWVGKLNFCSADSLRSAIVCTPADAGVIGVPLEQLQVYFEYYYSRRVHSYQRLWGMDGRWLTRLRMPLVSPDSPETAGEENLFVLGAAAREKFFPATDAADTIMMRNQNNKNLIAFFPGRLTEPELITRFLSRLDGYYPFFGGIAEAWGLPSRLYGKTFSIGNPPGRDGAAVRQDQLEVLKQNGEIYLRSRFGKAGNLSIQLKPGVNGQLDFGPVRLVPPEIPLTAATARAGTVFHHCVDESAPLKVNSTYIGGNHGAAAALDLTVNGHGYGPGDTGREFVAGTRRYYLLKVLDADRIRVISENLSGGPVWKFDLASVKNEIIETASRRHLPVVKSGIAQLSPGSRITSQKYLLDGAELKDGVAMTGKVLEATESYEIIAPDAALAEILGGTGQSEPFAVVENTYRFSAPGVCTVKHKVRFNRETALEYIGAIQSQMLTPAKNQRIEYYVPKTVPFEKYGHKFDFSVPQDLSGKLPGGIFFSEQEKNLDGTAGKPDRFIQFISEKNGEETVRKIGFALGYSPLKGVTARERRDKMTGTAGWIWTSRKSYPVAIDAKAGKMLPAGYELEIHACRIYFNPEASGHNADSVYFWDDGGDCVVYVDYFRPVADGFVNVPPEWNGRRVDVIEQSGGVELLSEEVAGGRIGLKQPSPRGFAVLKVTGQ